MILFEIEDATVRISVASDITAKKYRFPFIYACGNDAYAALLLDDLQARYWAKLHELVVDAYERGWRDRTRPQGKRCGRPNTARLWA